VARPPHYTYERQARARAKVAKRDAKRAERAAVRAAKKAGESPTADEPAAAEVDALPPQG